MQAVSADPPPDDTQSHRLDNQLKATLSQPPSRQDRTKLLTDGSHYAVAENRSPLGPPDERSHSKLMSVPKLREKVRKTTQLPQRCLHFHDKDYTRAMLTQLVAQPHLGVFMDFLKHKLRAAQHLG